MMTGVTATFSQQEIAAQIKYHQDLGSSYEPVVQVDVETFVEGVNLQTQQQGSKVLKITNGFIEGVSQSNPDLNKKLYQEIFAKNINDIAAHGREDGKPTDPVIFGVNSNESIKNDPKKALVNDVSVRLGVAIGCANQLTQAQGNQPVAVAAVSYDNSTFVEGIKLVAELFEQPKSYLKGGNWEAAKPTPEDGMAAELEIPSGRTEVIGDPNSINPINPTYQHTAEEYAEVQEVLQNPVDPNKFTFFITEKLHQEVLAQRARG
jgi:hypothetical protein